MLKVYSTLELAVHKFVYNNLNIGNALKILPISKRSYALTILIDVLEKFTYDEGIELLNNYKKQGSNQLIATPNDMGSQSAHFDNKYEVHEFQLRKSHFKEFTNRLFLYNQYSLMVFTCSDKHIKEIIRKKLFLKSLSQLPNLKR